MAELIRFKIVPHEELEVAESVKRSNKIFFISILLAFLVITVSVATYVMIEKEEPGELTLEERPAMDDSTDPVGETLLVAATNDTIASTSDSLLPKDTTPETQTKQPKTSEASFKLVNSYLLANREGWSRFLESLIEQNPEIYHIASGSESKFFIEGKTKSALLFNRLAELLYNDTTINYFESIWSESSNGNHRFIAEGEIAPKTPSDSLKRLQPIKPFHRGQTINLTDSLCKIYDLKVTLLKPLGAKNFPWGSSYNLNLHIDGSMENITECLKRLSTTPKMLAIYSFACRIKSNEINFGQSKAHVSVVLSMYDPK